jgi:hypothetical protein
MVDKEQLNSLFTSLQFSLHVLPLKEIVHDMQNEEIDGDRYQIK